MNPSLKVDSLTVQTTSGNPTILVDSLTFELATGKPVVLIGETGSGKSLIAQAILGNITGELETTGQIWIHGTEYLSRPKHDRQKLWGKNLGLLPQEPWLSLNPTKRALPQLSEVYELVRKKSKTNADRSAKDDLHRFHIHEGEKKFPHELSGGMAQRLVFCCSIAGGSHILVVDEPTKGLDNDRKADVIAQLQHFLKKGGDLIVITHDIEIAEQLGGETIVLRNGKVQEQKPTRELFASPEADYTKALIDAAPVNWPQKQPSPNSQPWIVSGREITKTFGGKELLSGLNLDIHRGEIVGLFGPSGSGKSTLGNILLGLIRPDNGTVERANGYQPFQYLKLYQDPPASFSPFHTLKSSMNDFLALHQQPHERFNALLEKLNLDPSLLARDPSNVSGGELQRCAVLRALMLDPVFLFADEPTSRLDPVTQKETLDLICETTQHINCGLLLVSHDIDILNKSCDRVIRLQ